MRDHTINPFLGWASEGHSKLLNLSYVGSATNFMTRWSNHYSYVNKPHINSLFHQSLFINKPGNFNWTPVIQLPNYLTEFILENPGVLSPTDFKDFHILRTFTQFEVRSYELAVLRAVKPNLNSLMNVNFTTKWDPNFQFF